jgi:Flp pilus assembly protein TadD
LHGAGIAVANLGRRKEAANAFRKAVKLRPDFEDARNNPDRVRRLFK